MLRLKASLASLTVVLIAASGCSSSGNGGSEASPGASSAGVAKAKEATKANMQEPTTIPVTEPLTSKPPAGETFVWMKCAFEQCQLQAEAIKEATEALGWNYEEIPWKDSDPATLVSGMKQALQFDPIAVGISGLPQALWQGVVPDFEAADVKIVGNFNGPIEYDDTVIGQAAAGATEQWGEIVANWVIADSDGTAKVLLQTVNDYPVVKQFHDSFLATMEENCPGCSVTVNNNTIAQTQWRADRWHGGRGRAEGSQHRLCRYQYRLFPHGIDAGAGRRRAERSGQDRSADPAPPPTSRT